MHEVQVAGDACGGKSGSQDAPLALPVPPLGGQDVLALKGLEDPQQASLAREVCLMVYQDLAGGFRAEEIVDAAKQDVQSRKLDKANLETTGCAQRDTLDVGTQRAATRGRGAWRCAG